MPGLRRVEGLSDLLKTLEKLPDEMRKGPVRTATRTGARVIADEARRNAPEDTGGLKRNIGAFPIPKRRIPPGIDVGYEIRGDEKGKAGDPRNAYYWRFIEMGKANQAPNPIFRNALASQSSAAIQAFIQEFKATSDRAVQRAKR